MSKIWDTVEDIVPIVGPALNYFFGGNDEKKQREQQKELTKDQVEYAKQLAEHQQGLALDTWKKTNVGAQKQAYEEAGMNPALMYGGSGGTGSMAGISTPMPTGGQAATAAQTKANEIAMGMQIAQMGLLKAQTEKTKAEAVKLSGVDTEAAKQNIQNLKATATQQEFINEMNRLYGGANAKANADMTAISAEERNLKWEMYKAIAWGSGEVTDENNEAAKALRAEFEQTVTNLANMKKEGKLKDAAIAIESFGANLAKEGIAPNSPWYVKIVDAMLNKAGIHLMDTPVKIREERKK